MASKQEIVHELLDRHGETCAEELGIKEHKGLGDVGAEALARLASGGRPFDSMVAALVRTALDSDQAEVLAAAWA